MRDAAARPSRAVVSQDGVGGGVARPSQQVGELVPALPLDERCDLRDRVEGVSGGSRVRGGDSAGYGVDGGAGSGVRSDDQSHWYQ